MADLLKKNKLQLENSNSKRISLPSEAECSVESLNKILSVQGYEIVPLSITLEKMKKILKFNEFKKK